jgi:hypothetical protein
MPVGGYWFSSGDGVGRRDELRSSFFFEWIARQCSSHSPLEGSHIRIWFHYTSVQRDLIYRDKHQSQVH